MKFVHWVRFNWDLDRLPLLGAALPAHYSFTPITLADEKELRLVIRRSFTHESSWGDAMHEVNGMLDGWLQLILDPEKNGTGLALRHGLRMIGAAILVPDPASETHLSPGPCVLMEYRNRGLGTALLGESLRQLREAGLSRAAALTKSNAPVAKFLYPKFNGILTPGDTPLLAA
ncbi:MAG: GNAT family N-acetyltransferase [Chthoniobacterales bacterium]